MDTGVVLLKTSEAAALNERIKAGLAEMDRVAESIHPLLLEAKEREAWRALGYSSWSAYCESLNLARRQSYLLLDLARAERDLSAAVGAPVHVPERAIRPLKSRLTDVGIQARLSHDAGVPAQQAVDEAIQEVRHATPTRSRFSDGGFRDDFGDDEREVRCPKCGYLLGSD